MSDGINRDRHNQIILYTTADSKISVDVYFARDNFWLTQKSMAELFGVQIPAIYKHLKNIFESGELIRESTISKMEIVQSEGGREILREVEFYNLDRVNQDKHYISDFDKAFEKYLKGSD